MLLALDIGNTNITAGLYDGETLGPRWRLATRHHRTADEYGIYLVQLLAYHGLRPDAISAAVIASVVPPLTGTFVQATQQYLEQQPMVVDGLTKTGTYP